MSKSAAQLLYGPVLVVFIEALSNSLKFYLLCFQIRVSLLTFEVLGSFVKFGTHCMRAGPESSLCAPPGASSCPAPGPPSART